MKCYTIIGNSTIESGIKFGLHPRPLRDEDIFATGADNRFASVCVQEKGQHHPPTRSFTLPGGGMLGGTITDASYLVRKIDRASHYPLLVAPQPSDPPEAILVLWIFDQSAFGEIKGAKKQPKTDIVIVDETYLHGAFGEILLTMLPGSMLELITDRQNYQLRYGKGELTIHTQ